MISLPFQNPLVIPFLSSLTVEEHLIYYDMPLCTLLKDGLGAKYIGHFIDYFEEDEVWFLTAIHQDLLPELYSGRIPLITAIQHAPSNFRFLGNLRSRTENEFSFDHFYACPNMDSLSKYLPNEKFKFFPDEMVFASPQDLPSIVEYAKNKLSEVIYHKISGPLTQMHRFPIKHLSAIGSSLQVLITNIATDVLNPQTGRRGMVRRSVETQSQFALTGIYPGSLILRLESIHPTEIFETAAYVGVSTLADIFSMANANKVCEKISLLPSRVRSSYLTYMAAIQQTQVGVGLSWGSPKFSEPRTYEWNRDLVSEVFDAIRKLTLTDDVVFDAAGMFTQGNMKTKRFTFHDLNTGRSLAGILHRDVDAKVISLSQESQSAVLYNVAIREISKSADSGGTQYEYIFQSVSEI